MTAVRVDCQGPASVPLILPTGLAYDGQGNLYFAETGRNLIRKLAADGSLSTVAGTGVQGYSGDGSPATQADFDSPEAVAFDASGDLLVADTGNHRIRRVGALTGVVETIAGEAGGSGPGLPQVGRPTALAVESSGGILFADAALHQIRRLDPVSGTLTVVAGSGIQGYSGDGGPATAAAIDSPYGLAVDSGDNLFLSDAHNHRIRWISHASGIISSVAGTGQPGFAGDSGAATAASLHLPRGLALDLSGNLYVVDSQNQRLRRVDSATGQIETIAGNGIQAFDGDSSAAVSASLNSPYGVAVSGGGLATFSDTASQRIRQLDSKGLIHTIAGPGISGAAALELTAPASLVYGTGLATATLAGSPGTGRVTFFDVMASGSSKALGSVSLNGNTATLPLTGLAAGMHHLSASYAGDSNHQAMESAVLGVNIAAATVSASPYPVTIMFGAPVPALTGSLTGVLPQDAQTVTLVLTSSATSSAQPGVYPIQASLSGAAAANYALTTALAGVTVSRAAALTTLTQGLAVHVASSTSGVPAGQVTLLDGASAVQTATLNATGEALFSTAMLTSGSHTLTATYSGNADFLPALSAPLLLSTGPAAQADFSLAASGQSSANIIAGGSATFSFAVGPVQGALNSPIQLAVSGLPTGASASFSPAYLPPGAAPASFVLTVQTLKASAANAGGRASEHATSGLAGAFALFLPIFLLRRRRALMARVVLCVMSLTGLLALSGCGTRTNASGAGASLQVYAVTVTATATQDNGANLEHTATVTLSVQ